MEYPTIDQARAAQQVDHILTFVTRSTLGNSTVNKCVANKLKETIIDLECDLENEKNEIEFLKSVVKFLSGE